MVFFFSDRPISPRPGRAAPGFGFCLGGSLPKSGSLAFTASVRIRRHVCLSVRCCFFVRVSPLTRLPACNRLAFTPPFRRVGAPNRGCRPRAAAHSSALAAFAPSHLASRSCPRGMVLNLPPVELYRCSSSASTSVDAGSADQFPLVRPSGRRAQGFVACRVSGPAGALPGTRPYSTFGFPDEVMLCLDNPKSDLSSSCPR